MSSWRHLPVGRAALYAVAVASICCGVLAVFGPATWIRAVAALPLVMILPGYAIGICWVRNSERDQNDMWLLIPALSLVFAVLGGLLLASVHRFDVGALAALMAVPTVGLAIFASREAPSRERRTARPAWSATRRVVVALTAMCVAAILAAAVVVSVISATREEARATSVALWAIPATGGLRVGVSGPGEGGAVVDVRVHSSGQVVAHWPNVTLASEEHWERFVALGAGATSSGIVRVEASSGQRTLESITVRTSATKKSNP